MHNMNIPKTEWVKQLREHARVHYEQHGWDYLVECWEDSDILNAIDDATTWTQAFKNVREVLEVMDSRRKDVEGEIF